MPPWRIGGVDPGSWPCVKTRETWFRAGETSGPPTATWLRGCLQLLTSGDYLTPVFVGMGFRDNHRAAVSEWPHPFGKTGPRCWNMRGKPITITSVPMMSPLLPGRANVGLHRRIGCRRARTSTSKPWAPLVFLNGTSVETGRRIIVAGDGGRLEPWRQAAAALLNRKRSDIFEMMAPQCEEVTAGTPKIRRNARRNRKVRPARPISGALSGCAHGKCPVSAGHSRRPERSEMRIL